jgi:hypothetical protein
MPESLTAREKGYSMDRMEDYKTGIRYYVQNQYGVERLYPSPDSPMAQLVADLCGTLTLSLSAIERMRDEGFHCEEVLRPTDGIDKWSAARGSQRWGIG